jgi:hypothetical protein
MDKIEVYVFEDADGNPFGSYATTNVKDAKEYALDAGLRVVARVYEFSHSEPVPEWDFTATEEDDAVYDGEDEDMDEETDTE